jgi:DNA-binding FadR family transcriptional regulator
MLRDAEPELRVARVRPAYAQVADQLRELIVRGDVTPGDRLPVESELSAMFGVSRSTVREALRTLSSMNLVSTKRGVNGGTFVVEPRAEHVGSYLEATLGLLSGADMVSIDEMLEARELLEIPAARMAATRRTEEQLSAIEQTLATTREHLDMAHVFEGHKDFHIAIMEASNNRLLEVMGGPIFSVLRTRFLRDRAPRRFWDQVADDHRNIYDAIVTGDEDLASGLMGEHLVHLRSMYQKTDRVAGRPLPSSTRLAL